MKSEDITGVTGVPEFTWCYNRNNLAQFMPDPCNVSSATNMVCGAYVVCQSSVIE